MFHSHRPVTAPVARGTAGAGIVGHRVEAQHVLQANPAGDLMGTLYTRVSCVCAARTSHSGCPMRYAQATSRCWHILLGRASRSLHSRAGLRSPPQATATMQ